MLWRFHRSFPTPYFKPISYRISTGFEKSKNACRINGLGNIFYLKYLYSPYKYFPNGKPPRYPLSRCYLYHGGRFVPSIVLYWVVVAREEIWKKIKFCDTPYTVGDIKTPPSWSARQRRSSRRLLITFCAWMLSSSFRLHHQLPAIAPNREQSLAFARLRSDRI